MDYILYEQNGNVATITINREKALNALNSQVLDELNATLDAVDLATVRCLVITGAGSKSFVAGADIGEMSSLTKAEGEAFGKKGNDVFRKIETFPIPVIAAVNGFALGGGCEISMSCDIRICSDNAVFGQPEVGLGITPGFGGTQRLARLVGAGMAKQMIYTARNIKAANRCQIYCIQCSVQFIQHLRIQCVQCFLTVNGDGCHITILLIQNVIHVFTSFHISIRVFKTTLRR